MLRQHSPTSVEMIGDIHEEASRFALHVDLPGVERITGEFQRRFSSPESADTQHIKAKFVNGVLEVAIPKLAQAKPHRITVEAA